MGLTREERNYLMFDWSFWGRPEQQAPAGQWNTWIVNAGRGFGKTRLGAEWVRNMVCGRTPLSGTGYGHIALVGETAADVRDVMVQGPSGILAVSPPDFRPKYTKSERRLEWPNGAVAITFSGVEPEQLRGPQNSLAWCLAGDTLVTLGGGSIKRLDSIQVGDEVLTRKGPRRVKRAGLSQHSAEVFRVAFMGGRVILGTGNHAVWTAERGFTRIDCLVPGDTVCVIDASSGVDLLGTHTAATTSVVGETSQRVFSRFTARLRVSIMALRPLAVMCIIRMVTLSTTTQTISSISLEGNTCDYTTQAKSQVLNLSSECRLGLRQFGMLAQLKWFSVFSVAKSLARRLQSRVNSALWTALIVGAFPALRPDPILASTAEQCSTRSWLFRSSAAPSARTLQRTQSLKSLDRCDSFTAPPAGKVSSRGASTLDSAVTTALGTTSDQVSSVVAYPTLIDVYDISVEGEPEFFANGILVHNCDEITKWRYANETWDQLQFGMRVGDRPMVLGTTTPKPIPLMRALLQQARREEKELGRENASIVVTSGSTFDNAANLAGKFLQQMRDRYAGTRLGRQELEAELLDDVMGALWTRRMFDVRGPLAPMAAVLPSTEKPPRMVRVVVAVDPSGTSGEDEEGAGDAVGIVAAGLGIDGLYYILADDTCNLPPSGWSQAAVNCYRHWGADRIVAERNYGGAMVEYTIRTADRHVSYSDVTATRGKTVRAEPIAALYERGRVLHIGSFPDLENELCSFTRTGYVGGNSPNRADALVWALTELIGDSEDEYDPHMYAKLGQR